MDFGIHDAMFVRSYLQVLNTDTLNPENRIKRSKELLNAATIIVDVKVLDFSVVPIDQGFEVAMTVQKNAMLKSHIEKDTFKIFRNVRDDEGLYYEAMKLRPPLCRTYIYDWE
ncbi:MAG: hypothetical protein R2795_23755 [Saprospiraceae bacterium]